MRARDANSDAIAKAEAVTRGHERARVDSNLKRPAAGPPAGLDIVGVQRTAGNRAAQALLRCELVGGKYRHDGPKVPADDWLTPTCPAVQRDTPVGSGSGTRAPTNPPPTPPQPLDYDRDPKNVAPVPAGLTLADVTKLLNEKKQARQITGFSVSGVPRGSRAEIFLLALVFSLAQRARWGTEADIVTAIDWPPTSGGPAPQGRVTVRIDRGGAASAELIATGSVPAVALTTVTAGVARLMGDYGFESVTGWGPNPTKDAAEISVVIAAFDLLKTRAPRNVSALAGVQLIRVPSLGGTRAGEFFAGSNVALGQATDVKPYLKLADRAFSSDDVQFLGGGGAPSAPTVPASFQSVLHEVGHAVETETLRSARNALVRAKADTAAAARVVAGDPAALEAQLKAAQKQGKRAVDAFYKKQAADYQRSIAAHEEALRREDTASDQLRDTRDASSGHTKRLQRFIDLINANNIRRFTKYSADNWPGNPDEFYAEAYSLWLADPTFLRTNYPVVHNFFTSGDYLR